MQHPILSILLLVLLLKTPCTRILHPGDTICLGLAPSLSNPLVNFPKFTIDFYLFLVICQVAYIKGLQHLRDEVPPKAYGLGRDFVPQMSCPLISGVSDTFGCIGQEGKTLETQTTIINQNSTKLRQILRNFDKVIQIQTNEAKFT